MSNPRTERNYMAAIGILNSRRRGKRPTVQSANSNPALTNSSSIPGLEGKVDLRGTLTIAGMREWLHQIGHSIDDVNSLNIIHVAGTKGKGSTCPFIESFLRAHRQRTGFPRKTGLYRSPHLIFPEERIRINFQPIARYLFAEYSFQVWDALTRNNSNSKMVLPRYLQLLALVAFHAFIKEGVDAAIFETHHGGDYDAANVIEHPVVTVVTPLGMDHVKQLGPSIESIAWHKAGIFKSGAIAVSCLQDDPDAEEVLRNRANEKGVRIHFTEKDPCLPPDTLQLRPDVQRMNCSVALSAVRQFLVQKGAASLMSQDILQGIDRFSWPGRFQLLAEGKFKWFLDGAHKEMSVDRAVEWFIENSSGERILVLSQTSKARDTRKVLKRLAIALSPVHIQHVIFARYDPRQDFDNEPSNADPTFIAKPADFHVAMGSCDHVDGKTTAEKGFGLIWRSLHPESGILYKHNIAEALEAVRQIGREARIIHTLVRGSQNLVGGALFFLDTTLKRRGVTCDESELAGKPEVHGIRNAEVTGCDETIRLNNIC